MGESTCQQGPAPPAYAPATWMYDNRNILWSKRLTEFCILGSHDAGMGVIRQSTRFASAPNTQSQSSRIGEQLESGARFFDLRPVSAPSATERYVAGHYARIDDLGSFQGSNGEAFSEIVDAINRFAENKHELIILEVSHSLAAEAGSKEYKPFAEEEWRGFFNILGRLKHKLFKSDVNGDLSDIPLGRLLENGSKVLLLVTEPVGTEIAAGFPDYIFTSLGVNMFNERTGSNDVRAMIKDQRTKLHAPGNKGKYFILSWTLTQSSVQAVLGMPSILDLARKARAQLAELVDLLGVSPSAFPNVLLVDDVRSGPPLESVMNINYHLWGCPAALPDTAVSTCTRPE